MRAALPALAWLAGCPKGPAAAPAPTFAYDALFRPGRLDYVDLEQADGGPAVRNVVTESWTPEEGEPGTWIVETYGLPPGLPAGAPERPRRLAATRFRVAPETGVTYDAAITNAGVQSYAPKTELPPTITLGQTWEGTHGSGAAQNHRACAAEATPFCEAGVAVACTTSWTAREVWMRKHWCVGLGWVGYEARVRTPQGTVRTWSEEVAFEGEVLPMVPIERRPWPAETP